MKLQHKITILIAIILIFVIVSIGTLSYMQMKNTIKNQMGKSAMDLAVTIASLEVVKQNTGVENGSMKIQHAVEDIRLKTSVQFIVVMDMNGIRYSHPLPDKIGKRFSGGDEVRVLTTGEKYVSEGVGTLGPSLRVFAPVYRDGEQVGAVCVGILTGWAFQQINSIAFKFIPFLIIGLILGIVGAAFISINIKKTIFGLEPKEIAWLLSQKETVLQSIIEGILAVNQEGKITFFNQTAQKLLGLKDDDMNKHIAAFDFGKSMLDVLKSGKPVYNEEIKIRPGVTVLCNYHLLRDNKYGAMGIAASFYDLTEVRRMAEEITGIKKMAEALRAQNHEFMNKLHTISGLIQLGEYDHAIQYISESAKTRQEVLGVLIHRIKDPSIAGLLLAKYNKAAEQRVSLEIDEDSFLSNIPKNVTPDELGSILGNLIDNSIEAVAGQDNGKIKVKIIERNDNLEIEVSDNGPGIPDYIRDNIYERGVTTKGEQRGYGLSIVRQIIKDAGGEINFNIDSGIKWFVSLPMERSEKYD